MIHAFAAGNGDFPWVDCFLHNYCNAMEHLWLFADDCPTSKQTKKDFLYPDVGKMTGKLEMPVSVIPRIPKNLSCDICGTRRFPKHQNKLWPVAYCWSRNDGCYPRKILRVHVPYGEWPQDSLKLTRRSVGIVCKKECVIKCESFMFPGMDLGTDEGKAESVIRKLADIGAPGLARFLHDHLVLQEEKSGAVSNRLANLRVPIPPYVIYDQYDLMDHRFLPESCQNLSAESIDKQIRMRTVGGAKDLDGAGATSELVRQGKGPGPEKNLFTKEMREWRSQVASKKPGTPLFETDDFEPVGILELIMGGNDMRSPSFLIGLNKSPLKGQGYACKEVKPFLSFRNGTNFANQTSLSSLQNDLRQHLSRALPKYEFYSVIVNLENLTSRSER